MTSALLSDIAVNCCAVITVAVVLAAMAMRGRWSPIERRMAAVIVLVALLYGLRCISWLQGDQLLGPISLAPAVLLPIAMLCLVEGLLRRHAPIAMKILVSAGTIAILVALALGAHGYGSWFDLALAGFQGLTLLALTWLILTRDRGSLGRLENRTIDLLAIMAAIMLPALVSDFRSLVPDVPVRMSALGISAFIFVVLRLGRNSASVGHCLGELGGALAIAILVGLTLGEVVGAHDWLSRTRLIIVLYAAILAAMTGLVAYILHVQSRRDSFLATLLKADVSDQDGFLSAVAEHPAISDLHVLAPEDLSSYSTTALTQTFRDRPVIALHEVNSGASGSISDSSEQVRDLLLSHRKSHALLINMQPLRLALVDLPSVASSAGQEMELRLLQRLAQLIGTGQKS